jgi:hypothetical protein|tara:strand:- start:10 stop:1098 length:1089 start_codon:yes stop_codon:yes gene_type:complete
MAYTTINDPSAYFQTLLYSGNASTNALTNNANAGNFKPDWLWLKCRNSAVSHAVFDTTRQTGGYSTLVIRPNNTDAESNVSGDGMTSIDANGFTLNGSGGGGSVNENNKTYVAWQWKANGGSTTTAAESGSNVGYTRQVNTTSGFAIIKYTGIGSAAAVIHGMGATPAFFTVKRLSGSGYSWYTYHHKNTADPKTENLYLNNADGTTDMDVWNDQAPNSTEIKLGTNAGVNADGVDYIMYAFAEKKGYSKFGSYVGNGNADGPFVYTGFKPAWLMIKRSSDTGWWNINDDKRNSYNLEGQLLASNKDDAEYGSNPVDMLSNGFKIRVANANSDQNENNSDYVYMAFAENPLVASNDVIALAR